MLDRAKKAILWTGGKLSDFFKKAPYHAAIDRLNAAEKQARANGDDPDKSPACIRAERDVQAFERAGGPGHRLK